PIMTNFGKKGKRKRGQINGTQSLIHKINDSAIREILDKNPSGLNISQIAARLPAMRDQIVKGLTLTEKQLKQLKNLSGSGKGDSRKTVRKHIVKMLTPF